MVLWRPRRPYRNTHAGRSTLGKCTRVRPEFGLLDVANTGRECLLAAARQLKISRRDPACRRSVLSLRNAPTVISSTRSRWRDILDSLGTVSGRCRARGCTGRVVGDLDLVVALMLGKRGGRLILDVDS